MRAKDFTLLFVLICSSHLVLRAQHHNHDRCGTVPFNEQRFGAQFKEVEGFETWLAERQTIAQARSALEVAVIPVVVHVLHNGTAPGSGSNISTEQILSQMTTLNEDFRRQNADTVNTPDIFQKVAVDTRIEFQLARQDPQGLPTDGIVRVFSPQRSWTIDDDIELKALSYWPSEDYLNIWVANLDDNLLGYAQFPDSDLLPGLDDGVEGQALTDGVVVDYQWFGTGFNTVTSSRGRVLTHEIGHYLGLRHIWGDAFSERQGCNADDFCDDTPNTFTSFFGCDLSDVSDVACNGERPMVENFMDYTNDACMNAFTVDQLARMNTVLTHSPRRASLLSSPALDDPGVFARDVAVRSILSPDTLICSFSVSPEVEVTNLGTETLTELELSYDLNGRTQSLRRSLNVAPRASAVIGLPELNVVGENLLSVSVMRVNGGTDERPDNDSQSLSFEVIDDGTLPFTETMDEFPEDWYLINPDADITWEVDRFNVDGRAESVLSIDYFEYTRTGEEDLLLTPFLEVPLDIVDSVMLSFDVAYAESAFGDDGLEVRLFNGCGDFESNTFRTVYSEAGSSLATYESNQFQRSSLPTNRSDWRTERIDLKPFMRENEMILGFAGLNQFGNPLYLDNIRVIYYLERFADNKQMKVYPNPSPDIFRLEFRLNTPRDVSVAVVDPMGKVRRQLSIEDIANETEALDLSDLGANMYILRVIGEDINEWHRILLQPGMTFSIGE